MAEPKEETKQITRTLLEELHRRNQFESQTEARLRETVLGRLNLLVKQFVQRTCQKRNIPPSSARDAGGKIFTFGSYRLGVHGPGADIDTLCVVPRMVTREDFFAIFEELLREEKDVEELHGVPEAFVPVIKMKFSGIEIDLLFARMALPSVPENLDLKDDNLLKNLDESCVRSLGGSRVTDDILRLVPDVQVFRDSLRAIKLWAKGGVAWAMLVARICQLYPKEVAGGIVSRFFLIMLKWKWPQPVVLKPIEDGPLQVRVWNPKLYPGDKAHRMPIITPAYPSMNSTHNVSYSTQEIMQIEFARASHIVDRIAVGQAQWTELFQPHDFFTKYRYYLQICASTGDAESQLKWAGTVESKIRQLVMKLENVETISLAHPFVKGFDQMYYCLDNTECVAATSGNVPIEIARRSKEDADALTSSPIVAYLTFYYVGLKIDTTPKVPGATVKKLDISYPTNEFQKLVRLWDKYDANSMGLTIRHMKGAQLPDFVFQHGERAPAKPGKRTKSAKTTLEPTNGHLTVEDASQPAMKKFRGNQFIPDLSPDSSPLSAPAPTPAQAQAQYQAALNSTPVQETAPTPVGTPSEQAAIAFNKLTTNPSTPGDGAPIHEMQRADAAIAA